MKRPLALAAAFALGLTMLSACGDDGDYLTVYNAQHEELLESIVPAFTEETGIEVKLRSGADLELANQIETLPSQHLFVFSTRRGARVPPKP